MSERGNGGRDWPCAGAACSIFIGVEGGRGPWNAAHHLRRHVSSETLVRTLGLHWESNVCGDPSCTEMHPGPASPAQRPRPPTGTFECCVQFRHRPLPSPIKPPLSRPLCPLCRARLPIFTHGWHHAPPPPRLPRISLPRRRRPQAFPSLVLFCQFTRRTLTHTHKLRIRRTGRYQVLADCTHTTHHSSHITHAGGHTHDPRKPQCR